MTFPAFKAGVSALRGSNGGFDSHTLPPIFSLKIQIQMGGRTRNVGPALLQLPPKPVKQVEARPGANTNRSQTGSNREQHRRRTQCLRPSAQRSIFVPPGFNPCAIRFHALCPAFQFKFPKMMQFSIFPDSNSKREPCTLTSIARWNKNSYYVQCTENKCLTSFPQNYSSKILLYRIRPFRASKLQTGNSTRWRLPPAFGIRLRER